MKHCSECGEKLPGDVKFCPDCGHPFNVSTNHKVRIDKTETRIVKGAGFFSKLSDAMGVSAGLIMGCCLAVAFIIVIIVLIFAGR